MKISVIGTGYVGLVTATCFADLGNSVIGVDIDDKKINKLKNGVSPIYEQGLTELLAKNLRDGNLEFTTDIKYAVENSNIVYIAVGTPQGETGEADLSYLEAAIADISKYLDHEVIIVNKSTVPVGTGNYVKKILVEKSIDPKMFSVVSNPEFLKEGSAINDFMYPDRVVVGSDKKEALEIIADLYRPITTNIIKTDILSAEMIKYASNAFLATKISFINEISNICDRVGANVKEVAKGMGLDKRIGSKFLNAGIGYGGSCFPKDTLALIDIAKKAGYDFQILNKVVEVNKKQRNIFLEKVIGHCKTLEGKKFAVWGLAFKDNTDDMRESPSLDVIPYLLSKGAEVIAYDPIAVDNAKKLLPSNVKYGSNRYDVLNNCDALLILTDWKEFIEADFNVIGKELKGKVIIDGRNIYSKEKVEGFGIKYIGMGI
ncbi:UDP-glucose/GDP-mannose dehydrogenase family protein [bacterium]|nr:UDP-glucose/GDP-mannose dehydrogenase family protein [bacterium]